MIRRVTIAWFAGAILIGAIAALIAGEFTRTRFTSELREATLSDGRIRQALLASEIARFRLLPMALADDRDVLAGLASEPGSVDTLNRKFEAMANDIGAAAIYLVGCNDISIAANNWNSQTSFVGRDYKFRRYVKDAKKTGKGRQFALGTVSGRPGLYLARRVGRCGVIVVKLEFDQIENQWQRAGGITFVTNKSGVILVTSRPEWRFAATRPLAARERDAVLRDSGTSSILAAPFKLHGNGVISTASSPYADKTERLLMASTTPDADGWQLHLAMPIDNTISGPVRLAQFSTGLAAAALTLALGWLAMRNRRRSERTAQLKAAVALRTQELHREMEKRSALEARAAQLREELRLANRLATLGQVTASVAHETAQPIAAIRNYAHVTAKLMAHGDNDGAAHNLDAIDRLAERIGIVTAQLRGFARKRSGTATSVPLSQVIEGTQLLLREQLTRVDARFPELPPGLRVHGEKVRLEQIVVNLIQNAIEALADTPDPRITLSLATDTPPDTLRLLIADNGPGIPPEIAEKLFTPFNTSRTEGLGLGLVIAQDIATEFGGALERLPSETGTVFALSLKIAP